MLEDLLLDRDMVGLARCGADRPAALDRERSLFYVACTRARDELVVTWSGAPSPFFPLAV